MGSSSESDLDVQSGMEFDDEGSKDDNLSDGYLSDSGSDVSLDATSEHDDVTEETSDCIKPYLPPQLQSQTNKLKLKKSINGLINRYSVFTKWTVGFNFCNQIKYIKYIICSWSNGKVVPILQ